MSSTLQHPTPRITSFFLAGVAIQEAHPERLWVQLSNNDELPDGALILDAAKQELYDAGLPLDAAIVGGGE